MCEYKLDLLDKTNLIFLAIQVKASCHVRYGTIIVFNCMAKIFKEFVSESCVNIAFIQGEQVGVFWIALSFYCPF